MPADRELDDLSAAMLRLADGDRSAFDEVYDATWPRVQALCRRLLDGPDADDASQQAMIKVFERAGEYDETVGRALPWVLGIAAWECRTLGQRARRRREEGLTAEAAVTQDLEARVIDADLWAALEEILGGLRPVDRETLLACLERRPRPALGATFRKRVQRAVERLRAAWRQEHG